MLKRFFNGCGCAKSFAAGFVLVMAAMLPWVASAAVPQVVASSQAKYAHGSMSVVTKVVMDSNGNLFTVDEGSNSVWAIPAGSTTPIKLAISGMNYSQGIAVDQYNDLIVSSGYGGNAFFIPAANIASALAGGSIGSYIDLSSASGFTALTGYYSGFADVTVDKNGVVYMGSESCNCGSSSIFTVQTQGPTTSKATIGVSGVANTLISNLPKNVTSLAVDTSNHLFYADGSNVYVISLAAGKKTATAIGSGFSAPTGVTVDAAGNLYVSDNNKGVLWEIPNENGTLNAADQFIVGPSPSIQYGVAFDRFGNFYAADVYNSGSINKVTVGAMNMGSIPVGSTSAYLNMTFEFNAKLAPASIGVYQGTGVSTEFQQIYTTCSTTTVTTAGSSCLVQFSFTPATTGFRKGAVVFQNAAGQAIGTGYLAGIGTGAALTLDPGTQASLTASSAWKTPSAVALDGLTNIYVADSTANVVQVISSTGIAKGSIGAGLNKPGGVAVDGAGNVIIADTGNSQIVMVPNEGGTLNTADQIVVLPSNAAASITSFQITSNVATFTTKTNAFTAGETVLISGLTSSVGLPLNGQTLTVLASNLSSSQFSANFTSAANVVTTTDAGSATPTRTGVSAPTGLSAGPFGGIYVADTGNARVLRLSTYAGYGQVGVSTVGSGYTKPAGVATDSAGNVYVTDATANVIDEVSATSGVQTVVLSNLNAPTSIAFDIGGSAYFVNSGTNSVLRVPNVNGALNPNTQLALGSLSLLKTPSGVAVNGAGNVAIADSGVPGVFTLVRTVGSLAFGSVNSGQNSISQTLTLTSSGTASLTLGATPYTAVGATGSFAVTSAAQNGCTASSTLTVGSTCGYAAVLSPVATGPLTDTLTFSTNAVNASALTAVLTGTGTNLAQSSTTLTVTPNNPTYGQVVTVTAFVTGTNASQPPTGTVTFYVNGIAQVPSALSKSAQGAYTATYTFPALALTASTNSMGANYNGDTYNSSSTAAPLILVIAREPNTTTAAISPTVAQPVNSPFTFTGVVIPSALGTPTGTMSLVAAGTTSPVLASATVTSNQAKLVYTPPGGVGDYQYQIIYSGDVNFLPSTSGAVMASYRPINFTITLPSASFTVTAGQSVQIPVTITGIAGYAGNITVGAVDTTTLAKTAPCTGLPTYVTCTFVPGFVNLPTGVYPTANPSAVIMLTLTTSVPPSTTVGARLLWPGAIAGMLALALGIGRRRSLMQTRLMAMLCCIVLGSLALGTTGCGGNSSSSYATPKGTTAITLTCSGTPVAGYPSSAPPFVPNLVNTSTFSLTVQ